MAEKSIEEYKALAESQKQIIESQKTSITELTNANKELTGSNKTLTTENTTLKKENETLVTANTSLKNDLGTATTVVEDHKRKIAELEANTVETHGGKTLHKFGKKKYRLLFPIKYKGQDVTDEELAGNEALLKELVEGGSGAISEVL